MVEHFVVDNLWIAAICRPASEEKAEKEKKHKEKHADVPGQASR